MPIIAPSILAADFANLQRDIEMLNESEADWIHVDIMDGVFVPNLSFGLPVVEAVNRHARKPLDVHLMIQKPELYVQAFKEAGAGIISVHYEACPHLHRNLEQIKALGCKAGVAINPHTDVALLATLVEIDGGVNSENANPLVTAGADVLVAGSFVFKSKAPKDTISALKHVGDVNV